MIKRYFLPFVFTLIFSFPGECQSLSLLQKTHVYYRDITIGQLLDSISSKHGVDFAYDAGFLPVDSLISVDVQAVSLGEWITVFFGGMGGDVRFLEQQVIIRRRYHEKQKVIRVNGRVEVYGQGNPIPLVNIGIVDKPVGTVTNDQGFFEIILPVSYAGLSFSFSHLGFMSKKMEVPALDTTIVVKLVKTSVILPEVQVLYMDPNKIVANMVERINLNYPVEMYLLTAFFRETIMQDGRFVDVSEAVVEISKPSYLAPYEPEQVRFIKGRKGKEVSEMDLVNFKLEGGPYHFSRLDVVRHRDFVPDADGHSPYLYTLEGLSVEHGRLVYLVRFKPLNNSGSLDYRGELRIDTESYALLSAVFELTPSSIRHSRNYLIKRDARRFKTRPYFARYQVNYRPWGNSWVLARVRGEVRFRIIDKSRRLRSDIITVSEMLVSDFTRGETWLRQRGAETFKADYVLSERIGDFDPEFWRNFNIIQPDEALENVFSNPGAE